MAAKKASASATVTVQLDDQLLAGFQAQLDAINSKLDILLQLIRNTNMKENIIMADVTALQAAVEQETEVTTSVVTLLNELAAELAAANGDQAAIDEVVAKMTANADTLAEAVATNTPADPANI